MDIIVTIGPVPTASVLAWIEAATDTVAVLRERPGLDVPAEVIDSFQHFIDAFAAHAAMHPDEFLWSGAVDDAIVRSVGLHWARIVSVTRSGRPTGLSRAAPEGAAFYDALAAGIADALAAAEGETIAKGFAEAVPSFDAVPTPDRGDEPIRVVIVDDHDEIRLLVRVWLEGDRAFEVVGEAADGRRAIDVVAATQPDAVVLDVEMPVLSGLDALPSLREAAPSCAVVVFSASDRERDALDAGATAYVSKTDSLRVVVDALKSVPRHRA